MPTLKLNIKKVDPMAYFNVKSRLTYIIAALVIFFSLFALWLRIIPMFSLGHADILTAVGSDDPLYNLRQVEQILANFPNYAWFDPMTFFPTGSPIYWGPLFPTIIAVACLITGSVTRPEIIATGLLIPPLMAALVVAIMYFIGKICGDWKTGLFASALTAVVTGQFFYRSLYGYMDHHIAEVLFSTIFCLFYMYAIVSEKDTAIDLKNLSTYKKTLLIASIAGIAYLLGLFTMPTMILFAMIVGMFTIIQFVIDIFRNRTSEYLVVINSVIFIIAIIGLLLFGLKTTDINLSNYSVGHIYAYLALVGGTWALYLLARFVKGKERYYYPAALAGFALIFSLVLYVASPQIFNLLIVSLFAFFGQAAITNTVQEARGWALDLAWVTFNYGLILMAGGALVMLYNNIRDEHPHQIFALVWSLVMLFSTWQHVRYEYYLAVNIALLSAVCVSFTFDRGWNDIKRLVTGGSSEKEERTEKDSEGTESSRAKKQKKTHKKSSSAMTPDYIMAGLLILTIGLAILFAYTSFSYSYSNSVQSPIQMNGDWKESLEWMGNNTPDTGVNYFTIYDPKTFQYPSQAYGVMSWWDYGHMITYIAKRMPNANPFQQGVAGPDGAAAYFVTTSEDTANTVLDHGKTRYVITDIEMDTGKFWAMATWYNATLANTPYQMTLLTQGKDDPNALQSVLLNNQQYYLTMVSRLHNFDGSMAQPTSVYYIEYADPQVTKVALPVITSAIASNASEAQLRADQYNIGAKEGYHATVLSPSIILPIETVPALRHYRLVHESPTNIFNAVTPDVKYVKVFEYVKGAHIKGDGIIEVPVVTNTGRHYTYRQQSINGEFIVPYSTTGNTYDVKTTGKYQIAGTGRQYDVPESAVMNGSAIQ
jgi:dolichyl-diphosphooligosaccharide--protein glycosyltransferase